jgi:hypothetical protein
MRRLAILALSALAVLTSTGCAYQWGGPFRRDVSTVYVEMFTSREFRRDIEFNLTEAVKKRIGSDTPYRLTDREKADTLLTGEVTEVRQTAFAEDFRTRQPREMQLTLAVRVQWKDLRSGKMLVDVPVQLQAADYLPPTGETDTFALDRAVDGMARQIVARMYEDW